MRAIGYVRVSTQEQAQHGLGLAAQRQVIVDFCRKEGYELVETFEDPGVPGTLPWWERAGLTSAVEGVKAAKADPLPVGALVVARWDRLGRDTTVSLLGEQEVVRHGATVISADGMNPEDETLRELMHVMASAERRALVARLRRGREVKAAMGGYAGGRPKVGWKAADGMLVVDERAAAVVRGIFKAVASGWSLRRVATYLNDRRELGQSWDAHRVRSIVRDDRYKRGSSPIVDGRIWNKANAKLTERRPQRVAA